MKNRNNETKKPQQERETELKSARREELEEKIYYDVSESEWKEKKKKEIKEKLNSLLTFPDYKPLLDQLQQHYLPGYIHGKNVCKRLLQYGALRGVSNEMIMDLATAGLFIDIGYIKLPVVLLNKSTVTEEEFSEIKNHTLYGADILKNLGLSEKIQQYVLDHHEQADGSGYINRKKLENLQEGHLELHIADVYEAIQENRCYRSGKDEWVAYQTVIYMCHCMQEMEVMEYMRLARIIFR